MQLKVNHANKRVQQRFSHNDSVVKKKKTKKEKRRIRKKLEALQPASNKEQEKVYMSRLSVYNKLNGTDCTY